MGGGGSGRKTWRPEAKEWGGRARTGEVWEWYEWVEEGEMPSIACVSGVGRLPLGMAVEVGGARLVEVEGYGAGRDSAAVFL